MDGKRNKLMDMVVTGGATVISTNQPLEQVTDALNKQLEENKEMRAALREREFHLDHVQERLSEFQHREQSLSKALDDRSSELAHTQALLQTVVEREKSVARSLTDKELEVQRDRAELHAQFASRETSLRQEIANQQLALAEREATFRSQSEELLKRTNVLEIEHANLKSEAKQRVAEHERAIAELLQQKEQFQADFQSRMESKATEYVDTALASLKSSEARFELIGSAWAVGGLVAVATGLVLAYLLAVEGTDKLVANKEISWALILFFGAKGAILLGLVISMVRVCLRLARSYLHESLKNAERRHAINYGKFYLSVYGAGTDGEKVKDVFAHWNISTNSAFSEKDEALPKISTSDIGELAKGLVSGVQKAVRGEDK